MSKSFEKVQKAIIAPLNGFFVRGLRVGFGAVCPWARRGNCPLPFLKKGENADFVEKIVKSEVKIAKNLRLSFPQLLLSSKK